MNEHPLKIAGKKLLEEADNQDYTEETLCEVRLALKQPLPNEPNELGSFSKVFFIISQQIFIWSKTRASLVRMIKNELCVKHNFEVAKIWALNYESSNHTSYDLQDYMWSQVQMVLTSERKHLNDEFHSWCSKQGYDSSLPSNVTPKNNADKKSLNRFIKTQENIDSHHHVGFNKLFKPVIMIFE